MRSLLTKYLAFFASGTVLIACGVSPIRDKSLLDATWNSLNDPARLNGVAMEAAWDRLPLEGAADQKGWSEDYWATFQGGITYRWIERDYAYPILSADTITSDRLDDLSPAEKYDVFLKRLDFPTVQDERRRTKIMKTVPGSAEYDPNFSIPDWEGLCHGWAPAALNFKEPTKTVSVQTTVGEMKFYPSDIKALLLYYQQHDDNRSTRTSMVSGRCATKFSELDEKLTAGEITHDQWNEARETDACGDVNAATFHLILANELGVKKQGFVVDVTRDFEVWNQPVNSFKSKVSLDQAGAGPNAAEGTVRELTVETAMKYTIESEPSREASGSIEKTKHYEYVLELDVNSRVIGGRWVSEERPDFIWRETKPEFRGYFSKLKNLFEKSL